MIRTLCFCFSVLFTANAFSNWTQYSHGDSETYAVQIMPSPNAYLTWNLETRLLEIRDLDSNLLETLDQNPILEVIVSSAKNPILLKLKIRQSEHTEENIDVTLVVNHEAFVSKKVPIFYIENSPFGSKKSFSIPADTVQTNGAEIIFSENGLAFSKNSHFFHPVKIGLLDESSSLLQSTIIFDHSSGTHTLYSISQRPDGSSYLTLPSSTENLVIDHHYIEDFRNRLQWNPALFRIEIVPPPPLQNPYPLFRVPPSDLGLSTSSEEESSPQISALSTTQRYEPNFYRQINDASTSFPTPPTYWRGIESIREEFHLDQNSPFHFSRHSIRSLLIQDRESPLHIFSFPQKWRPINGRHPLIESFIESWAETVATDQERYGEPLVVTSIEKEYLENILLQLRSRNPTTNSLHVLILNQEDLDLEKIVQLRNFIENARKNLHITLHLTLLGSSSNDLSEQEPELVVFNQIGGLLHYLSSPEDQVDAILRIFGFDPESNPEFRQIIRNIRDNLELDNIIPKIEKFLIYDYSEPPSIEDFSTAIKLLDDYGEITRNPRVISTTHLRAVRALPRRIAAGYPESMEGALVGLDSTIRDVSNRMLAFLGGGHLRSPVLPFLFVGRSGTGKTSLAHKIIEATGAHSIHVQMSEWSSVPGEINHEIQKLKLAIIRARTEGFEYSIVLMDEIDKRPEALKQLLPLLSSSDANSEVRDFHGTIFIFTSNFRELTSTGQSLAQTHSNNAQIESLLRSGFIETFTEHDATDARTVSAFLDRMAGNIRLFTPLNETQSHEFIDHILNSIRQVHGVHLKLSPLAKEALQDWYNRRKHLNPRALEREMLTELELALSRYERNLTSAQRRNPSDRVLHFDERRHEFQIVRLDAVPEFTRMILAQKIEEKLEDLRLALNQWIYSIPADSSVELLEWRRFLEELEHLLEIRLHETLEPQFELQRFPWPESLSRTQIDQLESEAHNNLMDWVVSGEEGPSTSQGRRHLRSLITQVFSAVELAEEWSRPEGSPPLAFIDLAEKTAQHLIQAAEMAVERSIRNLEQEARLQSEQSETALQNQGTTRSLEVPTECESALQKRSELLRRLRQIR